MDAASGPLPWPPPGLPPLQRQPGFAERAPLRPAAFGGILFVVGWAGILFQQGVLRQLIVGAPIFEEMAKLGPALALVGLLGIGPTLARMPFAWASGAAFGVIEHFLTYGSEPPLFWGLRVAFHLSTAGLSMAVYGVLETLADPRVRWTTTLLSSALHAANNLGALFLAVTTLSTGLDTDPTATAYSVLITATTLGLTGSVLGSPVRARRRAIRVLRRVFPSITLEARPPPPPPRWVEPPGP